METSTIINIIGLFFDILGVVLLFFYEPPKPESHALLLESAPSKEDREKVRKRKRKFSVLGLVLLIIGFSLQIISNFF
jgi:accessory gene regulator protein AgrB